MAVHDSDLPYLNPPGTGPAAKGPLANSGLQGQTSGQFSASHSSRPIPLKPNSSGFPTEDEDDDEEDLDEETEGLREISATRPPGWLAPFFTCCC